MSSRKEEEEGGTGGGNAALQPGDLQSQSGRCVRVTSLHFYIQECGFCTLSRRDGEILQQVENNTAFTSDATWPPAVCHSGMCFGCRCCSKISAQQLSEGLLPVFPCHQVEREAANTGLNLLFPGGPEGSFFFVLLFDGEAAPLELKKKKI